MKRDSRRTRKMTIREADTLTKGTGEWESESREDGKREGRKGGREQAEITKYVGRGLADAQDGLRKRKAMPPSQKYLEVMKDERDE